MPSAPAGSSMSCVLICGREQQGESSWERAAGREQPQMNRGKWGGGTVVWGDVLFLMYLDACVGACWDGGEGGCTSRTARAGLLPRVGRQHNAWERHGHRMRLARTRRSVPRITPRAAAMTAAAAARRTTGTPRKARAPFHATMYEVHTPCHPYCLVYRNPRLAPPHPKRATCLGVHLHDSACS